MDSNKDEGTKCMAIGKAALEAGDRIRAVKFFTKAQRLYPNPQVDAFLSALVEGDGKQAADEKPSMSRTESVDGKGGGEKEKDTANSGNRHRNGLNHAGSSGAAAAAAAAAPRASGSDATPEQKETVARIKRTKDYYQILGLEKNCSEEDLRKAYRKLSLKVHPDKNKARGAEEAFKSVSRAYFSLSDAESREKYDRYGPDEEQEQQSFARRRRAGGNDMFYGDIFEPNDVFEAFFGMRQQPGGGFRRAHFTRAAAGGGRQENQSNSLLGFLQLIPILALFLFSYFPWSQPVYNLEKVAPYHYVHKTRDYDVTFYVKTPDFSREYPLGSHSRRQLEAQVEKDYRDILIHNCRIERSYHRWGQRGETPYCEKLQRFVRVS